MKRIYLYITILLIGIFSSCDDYLDVEPKGVRIPDAIEDYDLLLAPITKLSIENELFLSADDFTSNAAVLGDLTDKENKNVQLYTYGKNRFDNPETPIIAWNEPYNNLYVYNKVINEIDKASESTGYTQQDRIRIKAEALYGRAVQYLFLVNMFAKHYDKATSATEPGVPIVLEADTSQDPPKRATVEEVYQLIIKDLTEAVSNLPKRRIELNRPSKGSGYALLARVYLYKGDYKEALKNTELALAENATLSDYTTANDMSSIANLYESEQYSRLYYGWVSGHYYGVVGNEALALFNEEDKRFSTILSCAWAKDENGQWYQDCSSKKMGYPFKPNLLPSVGEMYVTLAECYARQGNFAETLKNLNELRKHRITGAVDKVQNDFTNTEELLKFALEERRREMLMSGTRLFDLKRLNLDPRFAKTVTHTIDGKNYVAEPNSGTLVLPIPAQVKKMNSNL